MLLEFKNGSLWSASLFEFAGYLVRIAAAAWSDHTIAIFAVNHTTGSGIESVGRR